MEIVIRPRKGWQPVDVREVWLYRDLFRFLVLRDIRIRYRQTLLGVAWAVLQPFLGMVIFTIFFNRLAGIEGDSAPYPLFVYSGMVVWTFFSNAVSQSSNSLVSNHALVSKIYFPRVFIPVATIGAFLVDLVLSMLLVLGLFAWYSWPMSATVVFLPVFIFGSFLAACGAGLLLSAMSVRFRDIKYAVPFCIQMGLFVSPVIYPLSRIPEQFRILMGLNPMAGMVEGFRYALLGVSPNWHVVWLSALTCVILFVAGLYYFRKLERGFADII